MTWTARLLKPLGRHVRSTLLAGVLIVVPVVVTAWLLRFVFDLFDPVLGEHLDRLPGAYVPGVGIVALIVIVYFAGLVTTHVLGRQLMNLVHNAVDLVPVVRSVYRTARQATEVLSMVGSEDSKYGGTVVLVDFPSRGLKSIGLVTARLKDQDGNPLVAVYMPTAPLPTGGFLVLVPEEHATPIDMPVEDAMKLIVSAGIMSPESITASTNPFSTAPSAARHLPDEGQERPEPAPDNRDSNQ